jgi:acetyl esterase/lipase
MGSRHLVDPELLPLLGGPDVVLSLENLAEVRAMATASLAILEAPIEADDVEVSRTFAPGRDGAPPVPMLVFRPKGAGGRRPAILFIHGGGYFLGTEDMFRMRNLRIARDLDCVIVSVGYRLAPETPHPGPVEDCYTALAWLHDEAAALGVDPARVAIYGESAGGGLAAGLALLARDRGETPIALQILSAPMIDDRTSMKSDHHPFTGEFQWTRESNRFGWSMLLGHEPGGEGVSPYAAAARSTDLSGLPATFLQLGALDLFLEEAIDYALRLTRAGVATELHVYPGVTHSHVMAPGARVTQVADRDVADALRRAFDRQSAAADAPG